MNGQKTNKMISVIMPVYNIIKIRHKFREAVGSVLTQSYPNIELLIINDGSTDSTKEELARLERIDKRVKLLHKPNGGVESARRKGLSLASGDYVLHIDQDDMYGEGAFERFVNTMEETQADVAVANSARFIFSKHLVKKGKMPPSMQEERTVGHAEFMEKYYHSFFGINDFPVNIWNKMYRKSFIDSVLPPPITGCIIEDLSYNMHILPYAGKIAIIPDILYYYRWGGFTNRFDSTILETALVGFKLKMRIIEDMQFPHFITSTSIELLNYVNTYLFSLVEYTSIGRFEFERTAQCLFEQNEQLMQATEAVRKYSKYRSAHISAILARDYHRLYELELEKKNKSRVRRTIKYLLLKIPF